MMNIASPPPLPTPLHMHIVDNGLKKMTTAHGDRNYKGMARPVTACVVWRCMRGHIWAVLSELEIEHLTVTLAAV